MAAKKNTEEVKETKQVTPEETADTVKAEETTEHAEATVEAEETEKKDNFIVAWAKNQKEEFKAHPVKKTLKTVGAAAVGVLACIGGKTVINAIADNDEVIVDGVDLLTDAAMDVVDDTITEQL